jgi:hypothetical protein
MRPYAMNDVSLGSVRRLEAPDAKTKQTDYAGDEGKRNNAVDSTAEHEQVQ